MARLIVFLITGFFASSAHSQSVVSTQKEMDITLPKVDLNKRNADWKKAFEKNPNPFEKSSRGEEALDLQWGERKKNYDVASSPMDPAPRKPTVSHPLMPAREKGKLNHYQ